jgi:hypothetical protein
VEQSGIHDEEAPDWPPREPAAETPSPVLRAAAADDDEPTEPLPGLEEPTLELPVLELPDSEPPSLVPPGLEIPDLELPGLELPGLELPGLDLPQAEPQRSGPRRLAVAAAMVALVLVGFLIVRSGASPSSRPDPAAAPAGTSAAPGTSTATPAAPSLSQPADGRTQAAFDLVDGIATVRLRTADLDADLYRVTTPPGSGVRPRVVDQNGRIQLFLDHSGDHGDVPESVDIVLSQQVRWGLRVGGGVDLSTIDLSGARLAEVDLAGNATRIDLTLPKPDGTLTVRMSGGVNALTVRSAQRVPVRVRVGSGAGEVVLDGQTHSGVAAGALFTPGRWANAVDRVDLDAAAGMSALTVAAY